MEMHQIKYFLAVAKALNFTRAADQCNVTQPSLTRAIQKLEDEFGGLLFNRERALTHLTELGRMVLPHLEQTYEAAEAATSLASSIGRAEVTPLVIGVAHGITSRVLDEVLGSLTAVLPGLTIDLHSGTSADLVQASLKGGLDLLLIAELDGAHDRLETWPLFAKSYKIAMWNGDTRPRTEPLSLADAGVGPWIDCADDGTRLWRSVAAETGFEPAFRHRVDGPSVALRLVARRLGLAVLPDDMRAEGVCLVELADHPLSLNIVLGAVAGRRRGRAADAFLRAARARDWQEAETVQPAPVKATKEASTSAGSAR
jgi:DNA-binding transcriptional LysR family regulator